MEALAIEAFENYSGPQDPKSMLVHLFGNSITSVMTPIRDSTGQSTTVDEYLEEEGSRLRKGAATNFGQMRGNINSCRNASDFDSAVLSMKSTRAKVMDGRFILVSGSASRSCNADKLDIATQFVRRFTEEALRRGGGLVVLADEEHSTRDENGAPHVFDCVVLREVRRYAENAIENPRPYARIVMSDAAQESEIDIANLKLLRDLEQRKVVERLHIPDGVFTGGKYRKQMIHAADAMLAIGGGKGTLSAGLDMTAQGKPVLPLDLRLGSISEDGEGAIALHRQMLTEVEKFFPRTHAQVVNRIGMLSLDRGINDPATVARLAADML